MRDTRLETQLRLLTLQTESWKKLHDFLTYALDKSKPIISPEQERQFTEVRSILLQESEHVFSELELIAELSGRTLNVLQRSASMRGVRELSGEDTRRLDSDWNAVFTRLGVVQGQLKARRRELLGHSALKLALGKIFRRKASSR